MPGLTRHPACLPHSPAPGGQSRLAITEPVLKCKPAVTAAPAPSAGPELNR